jgi:hypothetical protein
MKRTVSQSPTQRDICISHISGGLYTIQLVVALHADLGALAMLDISNGKDPVN